MLSYGGEASEGNSGPFLIRITELAGQLEVKRDFLLPATEEVRLTLVRSSESY